MKIRKMTYQAGFKAAAALFLFSGYLFTSPAIAADAVSSLQAIVPNGDAPVFPEPAAARAFPGPFKAAQALNAYFISVGQGDSEYIELPNGKNALIDGGPANPSGAGDPLVAQFLVQHGITHIDYVVLTHPHTDHFTGLQYVFNHVRVDNFYDTREDNPGSPAVKTLRDQIGQDPDITVTYPAAGDTLPWDPGEVQIKVLNSCPNPGQSTSGSVLNDCSIVLKVTYQNASILYTGDMQDDVEAQLVSKYGNGLQADVLKVGHHGSAHASSSQFLNMVKPKLAYIEVGAGNSFGHPTQAALSRLQAVGASIHRTDLDGTEEYTIAGN